jgi:hypothetical protein
MEDRRKILIPIGTEPETPQFDAEETLLSARPVVPIAPAAAAADFSVAPPPAAVARAPFYKSFSFLALVVVAAIGIGLAAGLGIARYHQGTAAAPVATQPAEVAPAVKESRAASAQTQQENKEAQPAPQLPEVKIEETTAAVNETEAEKRGSSEDAPASKTKAPKDSTDKNKSDQQTEDNVKTTTPTTPRERRRAGEPEEDDAAPRAQRRDRRVRNRDDEAVDIPRRIERASEQINRIREIFEGSPQRP